ISTADPMVRLRMARVRLAVGDTTNFDEEVEIAMRAADEGRDLALRQLATWMKATWAFLRARLVDAERLAGEAYALHQRLGFWGGADLYGSNPLLVLRGQVQAAA